MTTKESSLCTVLVVCSKTFFNRDAMLLAKTISSKDLQNKSEIDITLFSLADWTAIARFMGYEPTWAYKMFCQFGDLQKYDLAKVSKTTWSKIAQMFHQNQAWADIQYFKWQSLSN